MKSADSPVGGPGDQKASATTAVTKRRRLGPVRIGILLMLLACTAVIWRLGVMEEPLDRWVSSADAEGLGFTASSYPKLSLPPHPTVRQRFVYGYQNLRFAWEYRTRNPKHVLIGAQVPENWDISRLLQQCMWVSGTRYLIARDVQGEIRFGTTNALDGNQWAAAAERALRSNGMIVIRLKPRLVQVVRRASLQDYIKAKLVDNEAASNSLGSEFEAVPARAPAGR